NVQHIDVLLVRIIQLTPPPRSTLFPYTTLFRSLDATQQTVRTTMEKKLRDDELAGLVSLGGWLRGTNVVTTFIGNSYSEDKASSDRKSTRLNSSHVKISYAVFCLKKKNR